MSSSIKCTICDKTFTSNRTLSLHLKSHNRIKEFKCMYCDITLASKQSLDRHITLCSSKKEYEKHHSIQSKIQNDLELLKQDKEQIVKKYEEEIYLLKQDKEQIIKKYEEEIYLLKEKNKEVQMLRSENINLRDSIKDKDLINKNLETKIKELESKKDTLYEKVITLQDNQKAKSVNNTYNINSNNNTNQQFNILSTTEKNIKKFLKKIDLVNNNITTENQYAKLLVKNGVNEFFRITDGSRGMVEWLNEHNLIQKDKYAEQLTNKLCDPEMAKKAKKKIEQQQIDPEDHDELIKHNKRLNLCSRIGTKDKDTIKNIGKGLIKNGVYKKTEDTSSETDTKIFKEPHLYYSSRLKQIYPLLLNFILEKPERMLFSNPSNIGGWLGEFFTPYVISSVVNREEKTCYVELLDDEEEVVRLYDKDFVEVVRTSINGELINAESFGRIFIQGLNNVVNDPYGFKSVVCSDEDPLDILFINLRWLGNWFLNWTGTEEEDIYKMQTKEMFSMFITSVPERVFSSCNRETIYSIPLNEKKDKNQEVQKIQKKKEEIIIDEFNYDVVKEREEEEKRKESNKGNLGSPLTPPHYKKGESKREPQVLSNNDRKNNVLKFLHQQQIKQKKKEKEIISTSFEEEKTFNKKQAIYNLKKINNEDNLYDISNSEAEH